MVFTANDMKQLLESTRWVRSFALGWRRDNVPDRADAHAEAGTGMMVLVPPFERQASGSEPPREVGHNNTFQFRWQPVP
jgi:hypothetical protein